ncbi:MAG: hypothetical protein CL554_21000 [Algoriphagus sp.]|uniref:T4 family baseplate hub assembly chaperone n=1 Tax=Algoriphagus sp. TaxID=1872435 RepID=UPI000C3DE967|nr:hypothetical protein [Algoriphagus sp.]MAL15888.1 hypothetical protein [Algoriphagus sp.]
MRNNRKRTGKPMAEPAPAPVTQMSVHPSLSYVIPTEFVDLPSQGIFYPEDHPLHNKDCIEIKYMTAKEEDILSSQSMLEKGVAIKRLLESIVVDQEVDVDTLLTCDVDAILISARASAYGSEYKASVICSNCFETVNFSYNLNNKTHGGLFQDKKFLKENNIEFDQEKRRFNIVLPSSKLKVGVRLLSNSDDEKYQLSEAQKNNSITFTLSSIVVSVQDLEEQDVVQSFINAMPAQDSRFLRNTYLKLAPLVQLTHLVKCGNCGHEDRREVPLNAGFFWPE